VDVLFGGRTRAVAAIAAALALGAPAVASAVSFDAPVGYPAGGVRPSSVAVGDVDGDGVNDVVVANNVSNTVGVLAGDGAGGFRPAVTSATDEAPAAVAIGDVNGDGRADLAVANRLAGNVSILLGTAGGGFGAARGFAAGNQPFAVSIGDVNGDGALDVVVANRISDDLSLLLGDGSGVFAPAISIPAGNGPESLALGDLDADGDLDAALALFDADQMSVVLNTGSGGFAPPALYTAGNGPMSVALGDLRMDDRTDIAVANFFTDNSSVFFGEGAGVFTRQAGFGAGEGPRSIAIDDLDADGDNDLAIADSDADTVSVLAGDGAGGFAPRVPFPAGDSPASIAIAELDGHGLPDIVVADRFGEVVSVLPNTGSPPPNTTPPVISVPDPITVDATSPAGAVVSYVASVTDDRDLEPVLACAPESGATFAVGTTPVTCTATDADGNAASATFTVEVVADTTAPVLTTPAPITVDATSAAGAAVEYAASALDDRDLDPKVSCSPASGSTFPSGTTTVDCTASDWSGNESSGAFQVKVIPLDGTAPTITVPAQITVNATSPLGAVVTYAASAVDDRDLSPSLACAPASGSTFKIGATTGECVARDSAGNVSKASVAVRVKSAAEQIADLIDKVRAIRGLAPIAPALRVNLTLIAECHIAKRKTQGCAGATLFIAVVRLAQMRGWVTTAQADSIVADIVRIKAVIGCP
jgi:hypothetical protein